MLWLGCWESYLFYGFYVWGTLSPLWDVFEILETMTDDVWDVIPAVIVYDYIDLWLFSINDDVTPWSSINFCWF